MYRPERPYPQGHFIKTKASIRQKLNILSPEHDIKIHPWKSVSVVCFLPLEAVTYPATMGLRRSTHRDWQTTIVHYWYYEHHLLTTHSHLLRKDMQTYFTAAVTRSVTLTHTSTRGSAEREILFKLKKAYSIDFFYI